MLCVGDVSALASGQPSALSRIYGQPLIHHVVKSLEKIGFSKFCIGVDAVPGALLHYRDDAAARGIDIQFVRDPGAIAAEYGADPPVLVLRTDIFWKAEAVEALLRHAGPFIAAVDENAENQLFERIDLNNRWAGLALLDARTLSQLAQLPDGWDMASALLRQAVQDGVPLLPIKQVELQNGNVRKLSRIEDFPSEALVSSDGGGMSLEEMLFAYPVRRLLPHIWTFGSGRMIAEWLFPILAAATLLLAVSGFAIVAAILAGVTIFAGCVRQAVRAAEYQSGTPNGVDITCWLLLAASVFAALHAVPVGILDAGFLALALVGLCVLAQLRKRQSTITLLTPLSIAAVLLVGALIGDLDLSARILVLLEITSQIRAAFVQGAKNPAAE